MEGVAAVLTAHSSQGGIGIDSLALSVKELGGMK